MLLRYIATVIAFSALFPLASAFQVPTAGTDATVSADVAVESLGPSLGDVVTNLVAEIAHELQSLDPNDLTTPGAEPSFERKRVVTRRTIWRLNFLFSIPPTDCSTTRSEDWSRGCHLGSARLYRV
ncbi:hypothetical protein BC629DRAFT_1131386 [Irpex lacteus]|nr:hypothetical protein BC629DRAFT_1131386 [Irpex lacteus]